MPQGPNPPHWFAPPTGSQLVSSLTDPLWVDTQLWKLLGQTSSSLATQVNWICCLILGQKDHVEDL